MNALPAHATTTAPTGPIGWMVLASLGQQAAKRGDHAAAIELFERALGTAPDNIETLNGLAASHWALRAAPAAERYYRAALAHNPRSVVARAGLGEMLGCLNRYDEAAREFAAAVALAPGNAGLQVAHALAVRGSGDPAGAARVLSHALALLPGNADGLCLLAEFELHSDQYASAEQHLRAATQLAPTMASAWRDLGIALCRQGRNEEAIEVLRRADALRADDAITLRELGRLVGTTGDREAAEGLLARAHDLAPNDVQTRLCYGALLCDRGDYRRGVELLEPAYTACPDSADVAMILAGAYGHLQNPQRGEVILREAIARLPERFDLHDALGAMLQAQGRYREAADEFESVLAVDSERPETLARAATALSMLGEELRAFELARRSAELAPDAPFPLRTYARLLAKVHRDPRALEIAGYALSLCPPDDLSMLIQVAYIHELLHRNGDALKIYETILKVAPTDGYSLQRYVDLTMRSCDWSSHAAFTQRLADTVEAAVRSGESLRMTVHDLNNTELPYATIAGAAKAKALQIDQEAAPVRARLNFDHAAHVAQWRGGEKRRIRVGYTLPYTRLEAFTRLHKSVVENHDRSRFEVFGYSIEPASGKPFDPHYRGAFEHFRDIPARAPEMAARMIHDDGIDVLLDVTNHTADNCQAIVALRPAPVQAQVSVATTTGASYVDYLVTDAEFMPPALAQHCTETVIYLPDAHIVGYRPHVADRTFSRAELGLPSSGFVYCSFNQPFKFEPSMYSVWMRILARVPNSVLWLGAWDDSTSANLRREAEARGVAGERIVFSAIVTPPEHVARLVHADLMLDTRYHGGGATTIDGFWAGVPLVTCAGESPGARQGTMFAKALNVPEMATASLSEYEELAVSLGRDSRRYRALRAKVEANRYTAPLFDHPRYTWHLERAIEAMWEQTVAGQRKPLTIAPREAVRSAE